jgi:hypothetical protein
MRRSIGNKYRLLTTILYGQHPGPDGVLELSTTSLARQMRTTSSRVRQLAAMLHEDGYLDSLEMPHGLLKCVVKTPPGVLCDE